MAEDNAAAAMDVHAAPQQRVRTGARRRINLAVLGRGSPAMVLAAGANGATFDWFRALPRLAPLTRVVAFDRAGLGFSDPGPAPRDGAAVVSDLRAALAAASIAPPYVLVGHSWGGVEMLLYAFLRPEEVAALVLVDTSTLGREQLPEWRAERRLQAPEWRRIEQLARNGAFAPGAPGYDARQPPAWATPVMQATLGARLASASWWRAFRLGMAAQPRTVRETLAAWRPLGTVPIIDLIAARNAAPSWLAASKREDHDALATLSTGYERRVVDSSHHILFEWPEAVVGAVRDVLGRLAG